MPSETIKIVIELMFLVVNMFLALLGAHFSNACGSGLNEPESDQKHIYDQEHQLFNLLY